jgi:predicted transport protein
LAEARGLLPLFGNLTLLSDTSKGNEEKTFLEKRDMKGGFAESPLALNHELATLDHWNQETIERRIEELAYLACEVWQIPQLPSAIIRRYSRSWKKGALADIIGPAEYPRAGFVPKGVRIIQGAEQRFYLFRLVEGEWKQYGDGVNVWYTETWQNVRQWIRDIPTIDEVSEVVESQLVLSEDSGEALDYLILESASKNSSRIGYHLYLQGEIGALFEEIDKRILALSEQVRREEQKHYIAYKLDSNFVDIEPKRKSLKLILNMPFTAIKDPKEICRDVTNIGHYGNGDVEIRLTDFNQLDDTMMLVQQAFLWRMQL